MVTSGIVFLRELFVFQCSLCSFASISGFYPLGWAVHCFVSKDLGALSLPLTPLISFCFFSNLFWFETAFWHWLGTTLWPSIPTKDRTHTTTLPLLPILQLVPPRHLGLKILTLCLSFRLALSVRGTGISHLFHLKFSMLSPSWGHFLPDRSQALRVHATLYKCPSSSNLQQPEILWRDWSAFWQPVPTF